MSLHTATVIGYPLVLVGASLWLARRVRSHDDFMVAGRSAPVILLVGSLVATWIGSGSLFAGAGLAYRSGISALWFSAGAWAGLVVAYFLAGRVRRIAQYTVPDLLETRYSAAARVLGTLAIILAYITIAAYQFRGGGWILAIATDGAISATTGMYLTALTIVAFTGLAGMTSIVRVDILNGIFISLGVLIALPYMVISLGGLGAMAEALGETRHLTVLGEHNALWAVGVSLPTFLLLLGESGIYQKFFSAKDENAARRAVLGMVVGVVLLESALVLLAVTGRVAFPGLESGTSIIGRAASETVILHIARHGLPAIGGAILLAAGIAIVLSTGNTFMIVSSTNATRDLYQRFVNPEASERRLLTVQRGAIILFAGIALLLLTQFGSILSMALYAYSLVGASITPVLLAAFLWKRATPQGGVACIAGGAGTIVILAVLSRLGLDFSLDVGGSTFDFASSDYVVIPGVLVSITLLVAVSLLTEPSPREKWLPFFTAPEPAEPRRPEASAGSA